MKATSKRTGAPTANEPKPDYFKILRDNPGIGKKGNATDLKKEVERQRAQKLKKAS
jgi:hypothetical protein